MARSTLGLAPELEDYLNAHAGESPILSELAEVTAPIEFAAMQIAPSQAGFLSWLVQLIGARRCLEVGVFTGYSSLSTALSLPENGYLLACDVSEEWTKIAREHWEKAGVDGKVELVLGPAASTLAERIRTGEAETYDYAFIDADKERYDEYYELCLTLLRKGGVMALDNMLWGGSVARSGDLRETTTAIRNLNEKVRKDSRVVCSLTPVGDGLLLVTKK